MKGNMNVYLDISWNIEDIEYIVMLIYTLYWIYIYSIVLLYHVCTWICQVYANALDVFLSNLYINRCCFLVHQQHRLHKHLTIRKKMKCCLWDLHVPVTDCYTVLDAWMRMFSLCYQRAREHLWHCFSLCKGLCAKRRTAHTAALCECVI